MIMATGEGENRPVPASVHVEFVPRGSRKPDRAIDTYADPGRTLKAVIATIVADTYHIETDKEKSAFQNYVVYINRPRNTPFFPIAANENQIKAFKRSLAHPHHAQIPGAMLASPIDVVVKKYGISTFTVYEATLPS
jgi:hypothetical protein